MEKAGKYGSAEAMLAAAKMNWSVPSVVLHYYEKAFEAGCHKAAALIFWRFNNNFYQNLPGGLPYETFFTRELPAYICSLFPVSPRREDTFIGGFSMGGYGAWHLGLLAPEVYSKAGSMSGALDLVSLYENAKKRTNRISYCIPQEKML